MRERKKGKMGNPLYCQFPEERGFASFINCLRQLLAYGKCSIFITVAKETPTLEIIWMATWRREGKTQGVSMATIMGRAEWLMPLT